MTPLTDSVDEFTARLKQIDPQFTGGKFYIHQAGRLRSKGELYEFYPLGDGSNKKTFKKEHIESMGCQGIQLAFLVTYEANNEPSETKIVTFPLF